MYRELTVKRTFSIPQAIILLIHNSNWHTMHAAQDSSRLLHDVRMPDSSGWVL